jgi:outer membrane protein assembly factor BamD
MTFCRLGMLGISLFTYVSSCRTAPISSLPQEEGIARIRKNHTEEEWSLVVSEVDEYRARYPYSPFIPEADLLQADSQFMQGRYPEAIAAYEDFLKRNPIHMYKDLAYFRIARSYDLQTPEAIDREQANGIKAIERYEFYLKSFPTSVWQKEALTRRESLLRRLAEHERFIADFYWKKDMHGAALNRYLKLLSYSQFQDISRHAQQRAKMCYLELADTLEKNPALDTNVYFKKYNPTQLRQMAQEIQ